MAVLGYLGPARKDIVMWVGIGQTFFYKRHMNIGKGQFIKLINTKRII
jgi:hypothetical protein